MQGPNGTGKSDRQRPGDSNTKKQAPHVRQARANKDIIPPQASGYTLASYPHAHVTCFHSHFIFQRCERQHLEITQFTLTQEQKPLHLSVHGAPRERPWLVSCEESA